MSELLHRPIGTLDLIAGSLNRDLDRTVIIGADGECVTAGRLGEQISQFQQVLEGRPTPPVRAALLARNRVDVLYISNALSFSGVVWTALHPMGSLDDYLYVIEDAGIDTLVYDADHFEAVAEALKARAPSVRNFLALGPSAHGIDIAAESRRYKPREVVAPICDPDGVSRISYSGGTTGKPKGILGTQRSAYTSTMIQLTSWEWPSEVRHLVCAPLSHSGASVLTAVLALDGVLVVVPGFEPVAVMEAIEKHRITSVLMVPTMIIAMIDHRRFGEFDLSSLEVIFYGASAFAAPRLRDAIDKLGPILWDPLESTCRHASLSIL